MTTRETGEDRRRPNLTVDLDEAARVVGRLALENAVLRRELERLKLALERALAVPADEDDEDGEREGGGRA